MKKTYNINLNGQVFCIDDDACLKLQSYIDTLESHYLKEEDGREIMADIESRIAELLKEALGKGYKQVVTMEDIDQIIRIMGSPDVIIDEDTDKSTEPIKRKLYRDTDESVLGGRSFRNSSLFRYFGGMDKNCFCLVSVFLRSNDPSLYYPLDRHTCSCDRQAKNGNERRKNQCFQYREKYPGYL